VGSQGDALAAATVAAVSATCRLASIAVELLAGVDADTGEQAELLLGSHTGIGDGAECLDDVDQLVDHSIWQDVECVQHDVGLALGQAAEQGGHLLELFHGHL